MKDEKDAVFRITYLKAMFVCNVSMIFVMGSLYVDYRSVLQKGDRIMISEHMKSVFRWNDGADSNDWGPDSSTSFQSITKAGRGIFRGIIRVITFDTAIYAEVADDKGATSQALSIVLISAFVAGVSAYIAAGSEGFDFIISQMFLASVGWVLWVSITYFIATQIFKKHAPERDWKSLARALGFAQSAGVLRILAVIPGLGVALTLVVLAWIFIASVLAIRGALGFESHWRAFAVAAIGLIPFVPVMVFLNLLMVGS